jgi:hypothetical protein
MTKALFLLIFLLATSALAQDIKPARLLGEFGKVTCEELLARADHMIVELNADPSARAQIVVSGGQKYLRSKLGVIGIFGGAFERRKFAKSRITYVRGPEIGEPHVELWIVPHGAAAPDSRPTSWAFSLPPKTKPFLIHTDFAEMCEGSVNPDVIQEYLSANTRMRVHVVIYASTSKARRTALTDAQRVMKNVDANRVRYFFAKAPGYSIPLAEYWLVPRR